MTIKKRSILINALKTESGPNGLTQSAEIKPYLALFVAEMRREDTRPSLSVLEGLPLQDRYIWRVALALKSAFWDYDSSYVRADVQTMSEADMEKASESLADRALQFCLFLKALHGYEVMERTMRQALKNSRELDT